MKLPDLRKVPWWGWLLGAVVLFGKDVGDKALSSVSLGKGQVPAVPTPANASKIAAAIVSALRSMGRKVVRQESWLFPLAVSQFETDVPPRSWRQLYNFNVGNVRIWKQGQRWYENPHEPGAKSLACDSLTHGARMMLDAMQKHGVLDAADTGDLPAFLLAMDKYVGRSGSYSAVQHFDSLVDQLRGTIVDVA